MVAVLPSERENNRSRMQNRGGVKKWFTVQIVLVFQQHEEDSDSSKLEGLVAAATGAQFLFAREAAAHRVDLHGAVQREARHHSAPGNHPYG